MSTVPRLRLGPADHGRKLPLDELYSADYQEGYKYEIIDGALYVSPVPNLPEGWLDRWVDLALTFYAREHPEVINYPHAKPRVFPVRASDTEQFAARAVHEHFAPRPGPPRRG